MKRLGEYSTDRLRLTREAFLAKHSAPVLLHRWETGAVEVDSAFTTANVSMLEMPTKLEPGRPSDSLAVLGLSPRASSAHDVLVFPISKRLPGGALEDRVSVGRSKNADIQLPYRKVSKFHAYFTLSPAVPVSAGRKCFLTDAGSTNGTYVNGRRLSSGRPAELNDRMLIHFSHYLFVFFSPALFYSLVAGEI